MEYKVLLHQNQEGTYVAIVPALPGCMGQGKTEEEAIADILQEATAWMKKTKIVAIDVPVTLEVDSQSHPLAEEFWDFQR